MNTMEITKIVASLCGALLVFLLAGWGAEALYHVGGSGHGGEDGELHQAYVIEVEGADGGHGEAEETVDFATVLASADAAKGEKVFGKCKSCHKLDGTNGTGPHLDGVVGRAVAGVGDFSYSSGLQGIGGEWTPEQLNAFLEAPKSFAPGTKMSFAGLNKVEDRADVIAYLESNGG